MKREKMIALAAGGALAAGVTYAASMRTASADDLRQVTNLAACYTEGIDAIGAGRTAEGAATWRPCFAGDFTFTVNLGTPVTCPGAQCSLPPGPPLDQRVQFARQTYDRAGFVATSHHVTTPAVQFEGGTSAHLKGHLQAWHWSRTGTVITGLGTWEIQARKIHGTWRIIEENLTKLEGRRHPGTCAAESLTTGGFGGGWTWASGRR